MVTAKEQGWGTLEGMIEGGIAMSQLRTVADRILDAVHCAPGCQFDGLVLSLPELTWDQVLLEVARLSRTGQVRVTATGMGAVIRLSNKEKRKQHPNHLL